jgi:hypothetical protein
MLAFYIKRHFKTNVWLFRGKFAPNLSEPHFWQLFTSHLIKLYNKHKDADKIPFAPNILLLP